MLPGTPASQQTDDLVAIIQHVAQLKVMKYQGGCMPEYDINADNPEPGMAKSFEHMRKVIGTIS